MCTHTKILHYRLSYFFCILFLQYIIASKSVYKYRKTYIMCIYIYSSFTNICLFSGGSPKFHGIPNDHHGSILSGSGSDPFDMFRQRFFGTDLRICLSSSWGCFFVRFFFVLDLSGVHPRKLTWNPKMEVWKMIFLFNWVIFRFHVSFRGVYFLFW